MSEHFHNPEILRPAHEFRHELEPERNLCLASLLAQVEGRPNASFDLEGDTFLLDYVEQAVTLGDEGSGRYRLDCQQRGCNAQALVERTRGFDGSLSVPDSGTLGE